MDTEGDWARCANQMVVKIGTASYLAPPTIDPDLVLAWRTQVETRLDHR